LALLEAYDWPGNVRELRNTIERGLAGLGTHGGTELTPQLLGLDVAGGGKDLPWPSLGHKNFAQARDELIGAWERNFLEELLRRCGGNVSRASREGGIERVYLHRLLKRYNLSGRDFK
jgi:DNA-binding NtrC family response regulator